MVSLAFNSYICRMFARRTFCILFALCGLLVSACRKDGIVEVPETAYSVSLQTSGVELPQGGDAVVLFSVPAAVIYTSRMRKITQPRFVKRSKNDIIAYPCFAVMAYLHKCKLTVICAADI